MRIGIAIVLSVGVLNLSGVMPVARTASASAEPAFSIVDRGTAARSCMPQSDWLSS